MPLAITFRFDPVSAAAIEEMSRTLAAAGVDVEAGYAPHLTLAIYPDSAPINELQAAFEQSAEHCNALPVTLSGFGIFPGPPCILWAAPTVTAEMLARHAILHAARPDLQVHAHYRPNVWVPHVTLAANVRDPGRAVSALIPLWRPVSGVLTQLDLVHFPPAAVLQSAALPPRPAQHHQRDSEHRR